MWVQLSKHLTDLIGTNDKIDQVFDFEATKFKGSPTATLTPDSNESSYTTTTENGRVYAFKLRLYVDRPTEEGEDANAERAMRDLVDTVLDDLDKSYNLLNLENQPGYTFILMEASPSAWGYAGRESEYRVAEIDVRCLFSVDVNEIT